MFDLLVMAPCSQFYKEKLNADFGKAFQITYADELPVGKRKKLERNNRLLSEENSNSDLSGKPGGALTAALRQAEVIIGEPTPAQLSIAKQLRWLQITWAGANAITSNPAFPKDVTLTNASGAFGVIISEYVIGAILAQYRNFPHYFENQQRALWKMGPAERSLEEKTVLILGTGDIGRNIAKRLQPFGTKTIGVRRTAVKSAGMEDFCEIHALKDLNQLLPAADIVVGCLPHTPLTEGLFDKKRLHLMKQDALLVNVGRGSLIVSRDLISVLNEGHLLGVVLDLTEPEPLPADSPLWKFKNVMITPHVAGVGFGHAPGTEKRIWEICFENLSRYERGEALKNVVDFERGY